MTLLQSEYYPVRRFRSIVVTLCILITLLVVIGLFSHRTLSSKRPMWKVSPYGDSRGAESVRAGH